MQINDMVFTYDQVNEVGINKAGMKAFNIAACNQAGFTIPDGIVVLVQVSSLYFSGDKLEPLFMSIEKHFSGIEMLQRLDKFITTL